MTILLIEDTPSIAHSIREYLATEHIDVDICVTGEDGLEALACHSYDVVVLDLMLPGINGEDVCRAIRAKRDVPIIVTTAKSQLEDKKELFEGGADDYLVKPFDLEELLLRIKALVKRRGQMEIFVFEDIEIILKTRTILKNGVEQHLSIKEFHILEYLLQHYGLPVSRTELIEHLRGAEGLFEHDSTLDVYISTIRKKLHKDLIQTIKGFGYVISKE